MTMADSDDEFYDCDTDEGSSLCAAAAAAAG